MEPATNVAFTRAQWFKYTESLYPDRLVANLYLDLFLIRVCSFINFAYKNCLNLDFLGPKAMLWKRIYLDFIGSNNKLEIARARGSRIRIYQRNDLLYVLILMAYLFFGARYLVALYINSSNFSPHHLKVSILKGIGGFNQATSVSISAGQLARQLDDYNIKEQQDGCLLSKGKFLEFVTARYGGFKLWNHTASLRHQDWGLATRWILIESHCSLQVYADEVKMLAIVVGWFILVAGLVSSINNGFKPLDIPSMAFMYMPEFIAFRLHVKINFYLDSIRTSYINFWATRQVDHTGDLFNLGELDDDFDDTRPLILRGIAGDNLVVDNFSLSYQQFRTYLPVVRRRAWRRILLVIMPIVFLFVSLNILLIVMLIFYYYVNINAEPIELNRELKTSLAMAHLTELSSMKGLMEDVMTRNKVESRCTQVMIQEQFRHLLVASLGKIMVNSVNFQQHNGTIIESLIGAFSPDETLAKSSWLVVWLSTMTISLLSAFYLTIYFTQMSDLCFWLAEIQTKLTVGGLVLRHYNLMDDERRLHHIQSTNSSSWPPAQANSLGETWKELHYEMSLGEILNCFFASWSNRMRHCERRALHLMELDRRRNSIGGSRRVSHHFLVAVYLDLRMFENEIDKSRPNMNAVISSVVFEALNILIGASLLNDFIIKMGLVSFCFLLVNVVLLLASFFQSQCSKLHNPIHSILAACSRGDKRTHHLALLWRKYLLDLTGAHSKFGFKVYSVTISYAATLQFCFSLASMFILMTDMSPMRR